MSNWVNKVLRSPKYKKSAQFVNKEATAVADTAKNAINDVAVKTKRQAPKILDNVKNKKSEIVDKVQGKLPDSLKKSVPGLGVIGAEDFNQIPGTSESSSTILPHQNNSYYPTRPEKSIPFLSEQDISQYGDEVENVKNNAIIPLQSIRPDSSHLLNLVEEQEISEPDLSSSAEETNLKPAKDTLSPIGTYPVYATIIPKTKTAQEAPRSPVPSPRSSSLVPVQAQSFNDEIEKELSLEKHVSFSDISIEDIDESEITGDDESTTENSEILPTTQILRDDDNNTINVTISRLTGSISGSGTTLEEAIGNLKAISAFAESM